MASLIRIVLVLIAMLLVLAMLMFDYELYQIICIDATGVSEQRGVVGIEGLR